MFFVLIVGSAFIWGAAKGYKQWKSQQRTLFPQRFNAWKN